MNGRPLTRRIVPTLVAALTLGAAGVAEAAPTIRVTDGKALTIADAANEVNVLTFWRVADTSDGNQVIMVRQSTGPADLPEDWPAGMPFQPEPNTPILGNLLNGCVNEAGDANLVRCTAKGKFTAINANLGGNTDFISNPATISGSQPIDTTTVVTLSGEASNDVLLGSPNGDFLVGGDGDDDLRGNAGGDTLRPGNGQNTLRGGTELDTVEFHGADRSKANVNSAVTLDGIANDGAECNTAVGAGIPGACERNNVNRDVENVVTGDGIDTVVTQNGDFDWIPNVITTNKGSDVVTTNGGEDVLHLGDGNDVANSGTGHDAVNGGNGDDELDGDAGDDTINAGDGANKAWGRGGVDTITALGGNDQLDGGTESDTITAGDGTNTLVGDTGDDTLNSGTGVDTVTAGSGNDTVNSGGEGDQITAAEGDDIVHAGDGDNVIDLGPGNDGSPTDTTDMGGSGKDTITGAAGDDYIKAGAGDNVITGDGGLDTVVTTGGDDKVLGGDARDIVTTGDGNDYLQGGEGNDTLDAGGQDASRQSRQFAKSNVPAGSYTGDTIDYSDKTAPVYAIAGNSSSGTNCAPPAASGCEGDSITSAENFIGGEANDWFVGDDATSNTLDGNGGSDKLEGKGGNDFLLGGAGDDNQLIGGAGGDYIAGGSGTDGVSYIDSTQSVNVTLDGQPGDGAQGENDNLQADLENIEGSNHDDYLEGSGGPNHLMGREGADELIGLGGPDVLEGNAGRDHANYETRDDDLTITAFDNVANDGGPGELDNVMSDIEDITTGKGNDSVTATDDANTIITQQGNDTIDALRGSDDVQGGDGSDTAVYSGRPATERVQVTLDDNADDGTAVVFLGASIESDNIHFDIENLRGGDEANYFEGGVKPNVLEGGGGNDVLFGDQANDRVVGGAGNDELNGGSDNDVIQPGLGADEIFGEGGTDAVDYLDRAAGTVSVTLDDVANDGVAGEGDNAHSDVEQAQLNGAAPVAPSGGDGGNDDGGNDSPPPAKTPTPPAPTNNDATTGSSNTTTTVNPTTQGNGNATTKQGTALEVLTTLGKATAKGRQVLVRGRILVKARQGVAKTSNACKGGGKVQVTIRKGGKVVGKRLVKVSKTCKFLAPVTLKKGTTGKLKVEVKFLGSRALKSTKRTSNLQVNG